MTDERKTPSKPKPSEASTEALVAHYNSQLDAYHAALRERFPDEPDKVAALSMEPFADDYPTELVIRDALIERIRRQNHRLGRHIKARSHELLKQKVVDTEGRPVLKNGRTLGLTYAEILRILAVEFPEASTSVACLRWYVVHMRGDARDEGKEWPDLPQVRPRSPAKRGAVEPDEGEEAA